MPIPKPKSQENQKDYMRRCLEVTSKEFPRRQAIAVCYNNWREKFK